MTTVVIGSEEGGLYIVYWIAAGKVDECPRIAPEPNTAVVEALINKKE